MERQINRPLRGKRSISGGSLPHCWPLHLTTSPHFFASPLLSLCFLPSPPSALPLLPSPSFPSPSSSFSSSLFLPSPLSSSSSFPSPLPLLPDLSMVQRRSIGSCLTTWRKCCHGEETYYTVVQHMWVCEGVRVCVTVRV